MVMNVLNVKIYLSNRYQTNDNYSFSEAKGFLQTVFLAIDFLLILIFSLDVFIIFAIGRIYFL